MAEFLTTTGVSHYLEQMIDKSEKWLVFISPFLRTNKVLRQHLDLKLGKSLPVWLIFGKADLSAGEDKWWKSHPSVHMGFLENLHAKCYLSEHEAIVTSLNLYDFSQQNNNEMGLVLTKNADLNLYESVVKYAGKMIAFSEAITEAKEKWTKTAASEALPKITVPPRRAVVAPTGSRDTWSALTHPDAIAKRKWVAHCIRCNAEIEPDDEWPYCLTHKASWLEWRKEGYVENYCHACGREWDSIRSKPLCDRCFRKFNQGIDIFLR